MIFEVGWTALDQNSYSLYTYYNFKCLESIINAIIILCSLKYQSDSTVQYICLAVFPAK